MKAKQQYSRLLAIILILLPWITGIACNHPQRPANLNTHLTYTQYQGAPGQRKSITLPDSSEVILNGATTLYIPSNFTVHHREVVLDGDAFFVIHTYPDTPFRVVTDVLTTTVRNAVFKVKVEQKGASVQLLSGEAKVQKAYVSHMDNQPEWVHGGEMVMGNSSIDLIEPETCDTTALLMWRSGKLTFEKEALPAALRVLADWYNTDINWEGNIPLSKTITGTWDNESLPQILDKLGPEQGFTYQIKKNTVNILMK
ncbi:FecR family protein [Chitinophaga costaii]|uniref:FecR family protein n=1 Tax=Chitinophaga costaii TaxID=1335309 RepID=A0A1C4FSE7_9BACT|nr:FecR family protein [Chitinophaga costaii]SCC58806.1 FecR family protein [Chitinophaga costaii]